MAFGNLALELVLSGKSGRLIALHKGIYDNVPIDVLSGPKKLVDVSKYYNTERLRPYYKKFANMPLFMMSSDP